MNVSGIAVIFPVLMREGQENSVDGKDSTVLAPPLALATWTEPSRSSQCCADGPGGQSTGSVNRTPSHVTFSRLCMHS